MGGARERLVRSVKQTIGTVLDKSRKPNDETLETVLLEAEAMINSRPLTFIPLELTNEEALTPNHFLLGNSSGTKFLPTGPIDNSTTLKSSWKLVRFITDELWRTWIEEYLPVITRRYKWVQETMDLEVGELVMIVGGATRNQWIRWYIEEVFLKTDGRIRQALVRETSCFGRRGEVQTWFHCFRA